MHKYALEDYPNARLDFSLPPTQPLQNFALCLRFCRIIINRYRNSAPYFVLCSVNIFQHARMLKGVANPRSQY